MRKLFLILSWLVVAISFGQTNKTYVEYIKTYSTMAIDQMHRYKIPASITLSQALLESGAGNSRLAKVANNHFGIKYGTGWSGPFEYGDDEKPNEKFRKYNSVAESYEDHSKFLTKQPRYAQLFKLKMNDYKGWAKGLQECGYATNPNYANSLISLIENYNLTQYDTATATGGKWVANSKGTKKPKQTTKKPIMQREVLAVNGIPCVKAKQGDTWGKIAQQTGVKVSKLLAYNEASTNLPITPDTNIFLAKKAKKGDKAYKDYWHRVKPGESMYSISQEFGVRVKSLYKMNFRDPDFVPEPGELLKVR